MTEAPTDLQETESRIKHGLKFIFMNHGINPKDVLCHFDCLTLHEKALIRGMESEGTDRTTELFDRLLEKPYWVDSFVSGIKNINNHLSYPDRFYEDVDKLFRDITVGVTPAFVFDGTAKVCFPQKCQNTITSSKNKDCPYQYIVASMEDCEPTSETAKYIKSKYSILKTNLVAVDEIIDKLYSEGILSIYDVEDLKNVKCRRTKVDKLLKIILRNGEDICKKFLDIISSKDCGSQEYLLRRDAFPNNDLWHILSLNKDMPSLCIEDIHECNSRIFPHMEEFMDLVVQTDAFSLQDHDQVLEAKTRNEQKLALLTIVESDREKQNTYWNILHCYRRDRLAINGFAPLFRRPVFGEWIDGVEYSTDGSELLMDVDQDESTHSKLYIRTSIIPDPAEQWNYKLITDDIMDELAKEFENKLKIRGSSEGSVIIELEAQSPESLEYLRQAYLDGTIVKTINRLLRLTGKHILARNMCYVEVQIGYFENREKRKNLQLVPHVQLLSRNHYFILEELDPYPVLQAMNRQGLLTENQVKWILEKQPRDRKTAVKELINIMKWKDQSAFDTFTAILQEGSQSYIYEHMMKNQDDHAVLRKIITKNLNVIAEEMPTQILWNLVRKWLSMFPGRGLSHVSYLSETKCFINDFIIYNKEDSTFVIADAIYASGLGHLLKDELQEKLELEQKIRYEIYEKVFEEFLREPATKILSGDLPRCLSIKHKDGKIYLKLDPEGIHKFNTFMEYCQSKQILHDVENLVFGKGEQRRLRIEECNKRFGVSIKDIGVEIEINQVDVDVAKSWLNKTEGLLTHSKNDKIRNLPMAYKHLLKDPLLTPSDGLEFLECNQKMLWLKSYTAKKLEELDEKIANDLTQIAIHIYKDRCVPVEQVDLDVDNDGEGYIVMYTKLDPEKRVKIQNATLEVLVHEHMIIQIEGSHNQYKFKSELLLDYLVTNEESFIWDPLHIKLFPYCTVFRSADFLKFWMGQQDPPDLLTEMLHEAIMIQSLDQYEIDGKVISALYKDGCFDVPGPLLSIATKYVMNLLIEKGLLKKVTIPFGGHLNPGEKTHFEVQRENSVFETFVLRPAPWSNVLKMCQIVSSIGGGQVVIKLNENGELRSSVSLWSYRLGHCNVDKFSLEIATQAVQPMKKEIVGQICQAVYVMDNLTVFKLVNAGLTSKDVNSIISSFETPRLLHLCLNGNTLLDINWSILGSFHRLEVLEMNGCKLSDHAMSELAPWLSKLDLLEVIDFGNNDITAKGVAALSKHLRKLRYLKALRIQKNNLGEDAVSYLANFLAELPSIEIINLSGCKLGSGDIGKLSKVLADKCIRKINLRENNISQSKSAVLLRSLASRSGHLQYLDYSKNEIGVPPKSDTKSPPIPGIGVTTELDTSIQSRTGVGLQTKTIIGKSIDVKAPEATSSSDSRIHLKGKESPTTTEVPSWSSRGEKIIGKSIDVKAPETTSSSDLRIHIEEKEAPTTTDLPSSSSKGESAEDAMIDLLETNSNSMNYLCLWNCGLGYTNIFAKKHDINFLHNLTSLCLQDNELDDEFAKSIGVFMKNSWHYLQHLNLNNNSISDKGVITLLEGLRLNVELEELYLKSNKVEKEGTVIELFRSVTTPEHKKMQIFDISRNAIPEHDREYLNQGMMRVCDKKSVRYKDDGKLTCMNRQDLQVTF